MDWIRRNWPDLLIGIALVAVIAGIIATLLTGGSIFPLGQSDSSANNRAQSSSTRSAPPLTGAAQAESSSAAPSASRSGERGGEDRDSGSENREAAPRSGVEVTALPIPGATDSDGGTAGSSSDRPRSTADGAGTAAVTSETAVNESPQAVSTSAAAATTTATTTAAAASDVAGLYRVSVGAFSSEENAESQASAFRAAGYPVFIGSQGELSIVLVGPYDDQGEAERVASRIRAGDFQVEPVIYRFRQEERVEPAASSREQPRPSAAADSTPAPQPTASEAAGARYLQVGAYASAGSAQPQRQRLEGLGFRVTERSEGELVKLLVGPFAGDDLTAARSHLNEQGIEHFPR